MGQPPKSFPPPGEYRGIGADSSSVAQVQPLGNASAMMTAPIPQVPMTQSPNSTSIAPPVHTPMVVGMDGGSASPVSPFQASIATNLNLKSKLGNLGTLQNGMN